MESDSGAGQWGLDEEDDDGLYIHIIYIHIYIIISCLPSHPLSLSLYIYMYTDRHVSDDEHDPQLLSQPHSLISLGEEDDQDLVTLIILTALITLRMMKRF